MSAGEIAAALVAVLLAVGAVWRRRRLGLERTAAALLVAVALGVYASGVLAALPDPKELIEDVANALGPWTYALVGVLAFLETGAFVGLVAPGETVVIAGGVIAGQGEIELLPLIGLVWACAILGDSTSFLIGRKLGRAFLVRHGARVKITEQRLRQVEGYFERHGGKTILIGRFIGLVRALAPFIAGSSGVAYSRFIPYSVLGTGLWASLFSVLGFVFWQSFDQVAHVAGQATFALAVVAGVVAGAVFAYRRLRDPEQRRRLSAWADRQERKPALRPLFAVGRPAVRFAVPRLRFVWQRLTPGELGLELTTVLAVGVAGLYVFVLYTAVLSGDPGPTPLDGETLDLSGDLRTGPVIDTFEVLTELGALPTVAGLVAVTALLLAVRRRPAELLVLLAGFALLYAGVHLAKAGIDRPRPGHPLVSTGGSSFPSGHATYSTAWVAVAVILTRTLGLATTAALVLGALAISAGVGITRIYLRAHFLSDVAGGWGLGFGIFGACAAVALIVAHIRQNGEASQWTST